MTRINQKLNEKNIAESFSNFMGYNWEIIIPQNEREYPDLLVIDKEEEFGLEVRQLFRDDDKRESKQKKKEKYNQKLLDELSRKYYKNKSIPLLVKIYGNIKNIFDDILEELIENSDGEIYTTISKEIYCSQGLVSIYITRLPDKDIFKNFSSWQNISDNIGFLKEANSDHINRIIEIKERKISKYLSNINKVSLLLYSDYLFNSSKIRFSKNLRLKKNGFQNIYLYENYIYGEKY